MNTVIYLLSFFSDKIDCTKQVICSNGGNDHLATGNGGSQYSCRGSMVPTPELKVIPKRYLYCIHCTWKKTHTQKQDNFAKLQKILYFHGSFGSTFSSPVAHLICTLRSDLKGTL